MRLSYTALRTFQQCHFRYHLRYDRGLASRPRQAAQSSRAVSIWIRVIARFCFSMKPRNAVCPSTRGTLLERGRSRGTVV